MSSGKDFDLFYIIALVFVAFWGLVSSCVTPGRTPSGRGAPLLFVQRQGGWSSAPVLLTAYAGWIEQGADPPPRAPARTDQGLTQ